MGVNKVEYGSSTLVDLTGDTVTPETLLQGETAHNAAGNRITGTARPGVQSFNGRSGSVLPIAGDYSANQVNYDSNKTVKQVIDALATKEASDITGQQSLLKDTVGWTGKNLLKYPYYDKSKTYNGITFTVNNDGSVTVNGTATAGTTFNFTPIGNTGIKLNGDYIISGNSAFSASSMKFTVEAPAGRNNNVEGANDVKYTFNNTEVHNIRLWIPSGTTIDNVTIYPMLRKADITDPTYEPYHESVEVMYEEEIHGVNLFKANAGSVSSGLAGITITYLGDGKYKLNGTCTSSGGLNLYSKAELSQFGICKKGKYTISCGDFTVQSGGKVYFALRDKDIDVYYNTWRSGTAGDNRPETEFIVNNDNINHLFDAYIWINKDVTLDNAIVTPMIRKADIEDSTYRPYNHQAIQNQLNAQGVLGAKNLLENTAKTITTNGVTFTVNDDKSVTVNGTATGEARFNVHIGLTLKAGKYILSGTPSGGSSNTYWMYYTDHGQDQGKGLSIDLPTEFTGNVTIGLKTGYTANNLIYKPMLRLASDPDDTYQPYAMTNKELTEKVFEKRTLTSADDLNNITETGIYGITTAPTNSPENRTYGTLIVQATSTEDLRQMFWRVGGGGGLLYIRSFGGIQGSWTPWYKFTGTVVS